MADETTERITILLQARDRDFARAMDRNNKLIARLNRDASRNTSEMARRVDGNLKNVSASVMSLGKSFAVGLGAGVVTAAFSGITTNIAATIKGIAQVGDEAKRAGIGLEAFQEWKFVAEQNRIGVDQLVDGFKELSLRADEFVVTGGGPAAEAFARLGYTGADLASKLQDPSDLMLEMIGRMEGLDKAAQIRIADEIFGGSAGERFVELLAQGDEGLRATIARAHEVGAVLDEEMIAKADEIDRKFSELATNIGMNFKSAILSVVSGTQDAAAAINDALTLDTVSDRAEAISGIEGYAAAIEGHEDAARAALPHVLALEAADADLRAEAEALTAELSALVAQLDDLGVGADVASVLDALIDRLNELALSAETGAIDVVDLRAGLSGVADEAGAAVDELGAIDGISLSGAVSAVGSLLGVLGRAAAAAANLRANMPGQTQALSDDRGAAISESRAGRYESPYAPSSSPRPQAAPVNIDFDYEGAGSGSGSGKGGGGGASRGDDYERSVERIREQTAALEVEAMAFLAVAQSGGEYGSALDYARKRAELLYDAQKAGREITPELAAEIDALARSYVDAGIAAEEAESKLEAIEDASRRGAEAISDIFLGVLDGSKSAKAAIADLLMEMAKVQMQQAFMGMSSGGGLFGWIGSLLGGARAGGGAVSAGTPYLVNENTPNSEVFVPSRSGAVLNVAQAKDALAGGGGGAVDVRVYVDEDGNWQAAVERTSGAVAAAVVGQYDRKAVATRVQGVSSDPRRRD